MLKLPVLLREKKAGGQYTVSCALHCLARYLCLGLHLPSAKWELAVEIPSAQPLQAQGYVDDTHTTRGPAFRWGDSPGTCTGLEAVGLGAAAGRILLWLVKCEHHHHTTGSFCEQEHLQDFLSSTWCPLQYPRGFLLFTCPLSLSNGLKLVCMLQNGEGRHSSPPCTSSQMQCLGRCLSLRKMDKESVVCLSPGSWCPLGE